MDVKLEVGDGVLLNGKRSALRSGEIYKVLEVDPASRASKYKLETSKGSGIGYWVNDSQLELDHKWYDECLKGIHPGLIIESVDTKREIAHRYIILSRVEYNKYTIASLGTLSKKGAVLMPTTSLQQKEVRGYSYELLTAIIMCNLAKLLIQIPCDEL